MTSRTLLFAILLLFFSGMPKPIPVRVLPSMHLRDADKLNPNAEYISWVPAYRLQWDDFLCAPQRNTDAVASTSTALGLAYQIRNGQFTYEITCRFSKDKSWGLMKTPYILAHEQGHFDITEVFARKLHQQLRNYKLNRATFGADINAIYEHVVAAKEAFQNVYDGETDHSRNKRRQAEWLDRIDLLLADTQSFAGYP